METALQGIAPVLTTPKERQAFSELRCLCDILIASGFGDSARVDFSVGNDLKYYSGVVFNGYIQGIPASVLSGGQYDKLLRKMGRSSKAIGFAIYMDMLQRLEAEKTGFDVDTVLLHDGTEDPGLLTRLADQARAVGSVLVATALPENRTWRRIIRLQNGEAAELENNG